MIQKTMSAPYKQGGGTLGFHRAAVDVCGKLIKGSAQGTNPKRKESRPKYSPQSPARMRVREEKGKKGDDTNGWGQPVGD